MRTKKARMLALLTLCLLAALVALTVPASADRLRRAGGACCLPGGACVEVTFETECDSLGGVYWDGESCEPSPCEPVGGVTKPLAVSTLVLPALAVAAGAAGAVALSRRACRPGT